VLGARQRLHMPRFPTLELETVRATHTNAPANAPATWFDTNKRRDIGNSANRICRSSAGSVDIRGSLASRLVGSGGRGVAAGVHRLEHFHGLPGAPSVAFHQIPFVKLQEDVFFFCFGEGSADR
jgi:hypothetical protein